MGYAGNVEPSHIIPTVIADHLDKVIFFERLLIKIGLCSNQ